MMDRHKRRDPVTPVVFVRDEPDALKTKVDDDLSVVQLHGSLSLV
jgi:hypothetical protein